MSESSHGEPFKRKPPHSSPWPPPGGLHRGVERPGVFGLETEYAVLFLPDDAGDEAPRPPFEVLQGILFECLLEGRKAARSSGLKGGYFLENGGLVHLEIYLRHQGDTPILEVATPECRTPQDVVTYASAYDAILEETSRRSAAPLAAAGYRGRLGFGKNNTDAKGMGFGCHENYLVYHKIGITALWLFLVGAPLILVALVLPLAILLAVVAAVYLLVALAQFVPPLGRVAQRLYRRLPARSVEQGRVLGYLALTALLFPAVTIYSFLLRHLAFRPFISDLTPFLVTRQVVTGSGALNFRRGAFELSQRAALTRSIARIIMFGKQKTIFDLKGLLYDPWELVRARKKLTLTLGDSNLSEVPNLLKIGTTALVIEMIEAGESFADLRLRHAMHDFREVSLGGPWKQLELRSGKSMTALALQREYLRRAKLFHADRPAGKVNAAAILRLWEEMLDRLADRPQSLADSLDWVMKKSLLDQAVLAMGNWKVFFAWGRAFRVAGADALAAAESVEELIQSAPLRRRPRLRRMLRRGRLRARDFATYRELYFQARKIDLRFHELSESGGYYRQLENAGLVRRLIDRQAIERAVRLPPADTRASVRGFYIRTSTTPESVQANWHEVELQSPPRHISIPDPFSCSLPADGRQSAE